MTLNFQLYVQGVNGTNVQVVEWSAIEERFLMFQDTGTLQHVSFEQTSGFWGGAVQLTVDPHSPRLQKLSCAQMTRHSELVD